jgi:hypothetical protein
MTHTQQGISRTRWVAALSVGAALIVSQTNLTGDGSGLARAGVALRGYISDPGKFPNGKSTYQSDGGIGFPSSPVPLEIVSLSLTSSGSPDESVALPRVGGVSFVDTTFSAVGAFNFSDPGSEPFVPWPWTNSVIRFQVGGGGSGGSDGTWPIEVLSIDALSADQGEASGGVAPIVIRESPSLATIGQHTQTTLPGGMYQIDSFFDVFFELSFDGGATYHPGSAPLRMNLTNIVPEPGTVVLALLGAAGCGMWLQRRR